MQIIFPKLIALHFQPVFKGIGVFQAEALQQFAVVERKIMSPHEMVIVDVIFQLGVQGQQVLFGGNDQLQVKHFFNSIQRMAQILFRHLRVIGIPK
ncbi:hypothetical protein DSECCO2_550240 [anaerobic digester metagenome]